MGSNTHQFTQSEADRELFRLLDFVPIPLLISEMREERPELFSGPRTHHFINKTFLDQIGYTLDDIPNFETWFERAYPDETYRAQVMEGWLAAVADSTAAGRTKVEMPAQITCKSGEKRWFMVTSELGEALFSRWYMVSFRDIHDIMTSLDEVSRLSRLDPLTNLANRREAQRCLDDEWLRFSRNAEPFSILIGDVDHFKQINDTYGHIGGDALLSQIAAELRRVSRQIDCVARWGGDEFLLILPLTNEEALQKFCVRLHTAISELQCHWQSQVLPFTMSFGAATIRPAQSVETLFHAADQAMYQSKALGRNRITLTPSNH